MFRPGFALWLGWIFWFAGGVDAEWAQRNSQTEPSTAAGIVHQQVALENASSGDQVTLDLARFSQKSARLGLIDNPNGQTLSDRIDRTNVIAGVNGGYFDVDFAPLGLRIIEGKTLSPLTHGRLLTGVVVSSGSKIQILRVNEFGKTLRPATAIQCGPFLIDHAAPVPGLDRTHTARRTFVALTRSGKAILGVCSGASLAELPRILAGAAPDDRIERALNLDGGSSSAFWFKQKEGSVFSISEQKSVRDFVVVTRQ